MVQKYLVLVSLQSKVTMMISLPLEGQHLCGCVVLRGLLATYVELAKLSGSMLEPECLMLVACSIKNLMVSLMNPFLQKKMSEISFWKYKVKRKENILCFSIREQSGRSKTTS